MSKAVHLKKISIVTGMSRYGFGIGFHVDRWSFGADFGPFWIGVEW
jgi:hypothetical protein